ncbi:MAG: hypothetical protein JWO37_997 [Acidimicrobiales bacterium]|nr:hypothetical protein [Acidimicrobiales bacterium]
MVLLILAVLWAAMLVPPYLRNRAEARPADSIGAFRRQMSTISRTGPGAPGVPFMAARRAAFTAAGPLASLAGPTAGVRRSAGPGSSSSSALSRARRQKRRRDVFSFLLAAMVISLVLAFVAPVMLLVHLAVDALFVLYVGVLIRTRNAAAEREMKVRFLPGTGPSVEPLLLRRSAN